ncbi:uncharacterized protein EI90DRAFT_3239535 [Cantharellus anzutake]|uniref:uncharacterized protein n=1 Tax=Cantharellus anzutake TaxID=1750568 RepID=UPI001907182F|nr:uncharacterized protein EI90DRAFT_3239535 [Cantharellus anzutake]KAF8324846.1 hypothetical protein EI90DRAFT_3239535 [Cantharellus anzutake]
MPHSLSFCHWLPFKPRLPPSVRSHIFIGNCITLDSDGTQAANYRSVEYGNASFGAHFLFWFPHRCRSIGLPSQVLMPQMHTRCEVRLLRPEDQFDSSPLPYSSYEDPSSLELSVKEKRVHRCFHPVHLGGGDELPTDDSREEGTLTEEKIANGRRRNGTGLSDIRTWPVSGAAWYRWRCQMNSGRINEEAAVKATIVHFRSAVEKSIGSESH